MLGIFWKGASSRGAAAGMLSSLLVTVLYMGVSYTYSERSLFGITHTAACIFSVAVNFLIIYVVSRLSAPPTAATQALVDHLRHP